MYCGSCLRDNALAAELLRRGHDVLLTPVYTPTRTDERNVSQGHVFFGGISVYLEQHAPLFRYTPRFLDRLWDSEWALRLATKRQIPVNPRSLGELTVSMLRGERGFQRKEIGKLLDWLRREPSFDVVNLPYALLLGLAEPLRRALKTPICCTLQGEDLFLDGLGEPFRSQSLNLIREAAAHVDAFLPVSQYYAEYMPKYLRIPASKMHVAPLGINLEGYLPAVIPPTPPVLGYFSRMCQAKGLDTLVEAFIKLKARDEFKNLKLRVGGGMGPSDKIFVDNLKSILAKHKCLGDTEFCPNLDRAQKQAFLRSLTVMSTPALYGEAFGLYVIEALASGVPVVQPRHAAFPELIEATKGGLLCEPGNPTALADGIEQLLLDTRKARAMGEAGRNAVLQNFSVERMARDMVEVFQEVSQRHPHSRLSPLNSQPR